MIAWALVACIVLALIIHDHRYRYPIVSIVLLSVPVLLCLLFNVPHFVGYYIAVCIAFGAMYVSLRPSKAELLEIERSMKEYEDSQ